LNSVISIALGLGGLTLVALFSQMPGLSQPGSDDNGYISSEFIFLPSDKPTPQCHASTICETPNGLVAAWFGGKHERNPDVGIWFSRKTASGWIPPVELVDGSEGEGRNHPCWNPVLFLPKGGPLLLFYKVGPSPSRWWGMVMESDNFGRTWSPPRRLGSDDRLGLPNRNLIGPVKNKPIQLDDGSILCPSSSEHDGWRIHFERMEKDPESGRWEVVDVIGPIHDGDKFAAIQPSILRYPDGRMQVMCRSRQSVVVTSWSQDEGRRWGPVFATKLPNPSAGTDAVTLKDGRQMIVYNPTTRLTGNRSRLQVALSVNGRDWKPGLMLEDEKEGEFSYPAVIQTSDGLVHVTYTYLRETIKHVVLDPQLIDD
jgi:predicted neuraminidase